MSNTCAECGRTATVGLGKDPIWLCLEHFDARLKNVAATVKAARAALLQD